MSLADPKLDTCGCCGFRGPAGACGCAPARAEGPRPGLPAIPYRVGTQSSFLAAMRAALDHEPALDAFTTRDPSDPVIGLLDGWATVLDVVTFYQERIANEGYLRTATELKSVYNLAGEIGYIPSAGVATSTYLAFELESGKGAPATVPIDVGVKVQSLPGPGEKPQTFETVETITARPSWNSLVPRQIDPTRLPQYGDLTLYLAGTTTGLKPGEAVLVVTSSPRHGEVRTVAAVGVDTELQVTRVTLDATISSGSAELPGSSPEAGVYALRQSAHLFAYNTPPWLSMSQKFRYDYLTAIDWDTTAPTDWPNFTISGIRAPGASVYLDAPYPKVLPGSLAVLRDPAPFARVFYIYAAARVAAAAFTVAGDVTQLTLDSDPAKDFDARVRDTEALVQSEPLAVAWPDEEPVTGTSVTFATSVPGLQSGQALAFTGPIEKVEIGPDFPNNSFVWPPRKLVVGELVEVADDPVLIPYWIDTWPLRAEDGKEFRVYTWSDPRLKTILRHVPPPGTEQVAEVARIDQVDDSDPSRTTITLQTALLHRYVRRRLSVCANVVRATHGESKQETLGSGDRSQAFQRFSLKQSPLTFVPSSGGTGASSTLDVRVNGVRWHAVQALYGRGPRDRVFVTRIADDGSVAIEFGDGETGARLPTGAENVTASYRVGIGLSGRVRTGQLSLLQTRPLGVKSVVNAVPATGGAEPEQREQARRNAPLTVTTFGRVVSLTDFENYAAAFAGIAKARAAWLWDGHRRIVHVTVAAEGGQAVDATTLKNLSDAIGSAGDGRQRFALQSYQALTFDVSARLYVDPDYDWPLVRAGAVKSLTTEFGFDMREFATPVAESGVMAALQRVPGVLGVDLVGLNLTGASVQPMRILDAHPARLESGAVSAAQLLTVNPGGIDIEEQT